MGEALGSIKSLEEGDCLVAFSRCRERGLGTASFHDLGAACFVLQLIPRGSCPYPISAVPDKVLGDP